jgi:hypothetical protein
MEFRELVKPRPTPLVFQQAVEIEAVLTDREPAAVHDTVDAESEAIFASEGIVAL